MSDVEYLRSTKAIRDRAEEILELNLKDEGQFFVDLNKMDAVADYVVKVIREKYPHLDIPYHSRWGHFRVGGRDRVAEFLDKLSDKDKNEQARCLFDLVITSVLLDAGAGPDWKYTDEKGQLISRSEGLAIASYDMFISGAFSSEPEFEPHRADAPGLMGTTAERIEKGFQVSVGNPLVGVKGRAELMFRLGKACEANPSGLFGDDVKRPGHLFDAITAHAADNKIRGHKILDIVLQALGPIWPGRVVMNDGNLGDCWMHEGLGNGPQAFVPFHKLSQWMTYSLLEPLEHAGYEIIDLHELTGLAEYRNGGLIIDSGLVTPKSADAFERPWPPDSKLIIEWRALTVALLDRLAEAVRGKLKKTQEEFPLAKVLEGGTWWAGRKLAQEMRDGTPPINIVSDGTVF